MKVMTNAPKPRIVSSSSVDVFGTSSETMSRVTAKPNTASLKPSMRVMSWLRQRKPSTGSWCAINLSRSIGAVHRRRRMPDRQRHRLQFSSGLGVVRTNKDEHQPDRDLEEG